MHHVALQRHQAELIPPRPLDGDAVVQVLGHYGAAQQVVHDPLILRIEFDQLRGQAHAPRHGQHIALLRGQRAPAHGGDGQERGAPEAVLAQVFDHALGVLVAVHHDVLQCPAQHHVQRPLQAGRDVDQVGHHAVHPGIGDAPGLHQHLLDGIVIALVVPLHLLEQLEAGVPLLPLGLQSGDPLLELLGLIAQGLDPGLHLGDLRIQLGLALGLALQQIPGGLHVRAQSVHAGLLPAAVGLHAAQTVGQGGLHGAQPRPLTLHIAQAVHGLDDLLLGLVGALLHLGELRLGPGQARLLLCKRVGVLVDDLGLQGDALRHLVDLAADALPALGGGGALPGEAVALLLPGGDALAHDLHRALAGLHLADQPLDDLALLAGLHLILIQLCLGPVALRAPGLQRAVGLQDGFAQRLHGGLEVLDALLVALGAHQEHVQVQHLQFVPQLQILPCRLGLLFERLHPGFQLGEDVLDAVQVVLGVGDALLGVLLAGLVLDDACGLLEHLPAVLGLRGQYLVDAALADQRIAVLADARVPEQVHDVLQAAGRAVDLVLALAGTVDPTGDLHLGEVDGQGVVLVFKDQRHLAVAQPPPLFGAVEDDVLHLGAAQGFCALLAQHPPHGVGDVGLAAAVGSHHAGDAVFKCDLHVVRKGLEPVKHQLLQSQCTITPQKTMGNWEWEIENKRPPPLRGHASFSISHSPFPIRCYFLPSFLSASRAASCWACCLLEPVPSPSARSSVTAR